MIVFVCGVFFLSSNLPDFESFNCSAYFLPIESHTAMRDPYHRNFAFSDEAFDATPLQIKALRKFILCEQRIRHLSSGSLGHSTLRVQTLDCLFLHFVTHSVLRAANTEERSSDPAIARDYRQVPTGLCSDDRHLRINSSTDRAWEPQIKFGRRVAHIGSNRC